jgi:hypothetical protein
MFIQPDAARYGRTADLRRLRNTLGLEHLKGVKLWRRHPAIAAQADNWRMLSA